MGQCHTSPLHHDAYAPAKLEVATSNALDGDAFTRKYIQSNLDYSKCQGPQESFRIIGSSNDRKREFSDIFGKTRMLSKNVIVLPEFATSTHDFREVIRTSVKALKKISSLEVVASSFLMLCRSKNAEN